MEMNNVPNGQRKLRKIKRPKNPGVSQPTTYVVPEKINGTQMPYGEENYFANNGDAENIRFIGEEDEYYEDDNSMATLIKNKTVMMMLVMAGLVGILLGSTAFSSSKQKNTHKGLDGVVINSEVPKGRGRCGLVEPHQGCVLYIMNPKNKEMNGRDFYATAAQWTQRERYLIETGNMQYSNQRIKPGHIAQIYIPPLISK